MDFEEKIIKANLYKLLAECFYHPDKEQFETIKKGSEKFPDLFDKLFHKKETLKDIQVDHAALFVGPFKVLASPYGSIYLEEGNQLYGDSTIDVARLYQQENLQVDLNEPPDHISIELEYMQFLIVKEIEALQGSNILLAEEYLNKQKQFIKKHLSNWVNEFSDMVLNHSKTGFYHIIAKYLKDFIREEINEFQLI